MIDKLVYLKLHLFQKGYKANHARSFPCREHGIWLFDQVVGEL